MTTNDEKITKCLVVLGFKPNFDYCSNTNTIKKRFAKLELKYNSDEGIINDDQFKSIEYAYYHIMSSAFRQIDKNETTRSFRLILSTWIHWGFKITFVLLTICLVSLLGFQQISIEQC